ncbi:MAG: hypothetical protein NTZ93_00045 [Candidatus Beckwithbacteria bacterium]|nr:hypothetical protein [Candidatus Beckwithbacteria bacterium]
MFNIENLPGSLRNSNGRYDLVELLTEARNQRLADGRLNWAEIAAQENITISPQEITFGDTQIAVITNGAPQCLTPAAVGLKFLSASLETKGFSLPDITQENNWLIAISEQAPHDLYPYGSAMIQLFMNHAALTAKLINAKDRFELYRQTIPPQILELILKESPTL